MPPIQVLSSFDYSLQGRRSRAIAFAEGSEPIGSVSYIVGIPSGRFSSLPGLGIQTLRVGLLLPVSLSCPTSFIRAFGDSDLTPSTPAVFLPRLSCDTLRTAKYFT